MHKEPLAFRMRPKEIDDMIGQQHVIGKGTPLYQSLKNGFVPPVLIYGPPGTGKTSLANVISRSSDAPFFSLNATKSGKKDIENIIKESEKHQKVILFIDEIHLFNKTQQATLLPALEEGKITLIGATTENPFHDVNPAIRSRCGQILQLKFLTTEDIFKALKRAVEDKENGLGELDIVINDKQLTAIAESVTGDIRKALTILENLIYATETENNKYIVKDEMIKHFVNQISTYSDGKKSQFYDTLSSLQKSIRGSDVSASLYYLALLLEGGDLIATCRRILVISFEDIGNANRNLANNVKTAVDAAISLGMPEARIPLAKAVIEMCLSEKSNSAYKALDSAISLVRSGHTPNIPNHLKDTHYASASALGHTGYKYPHDTPVGTFGGWTKQQYLPDDLVGIEFYKPVISGDEKRLAAVYEKLKELNSD